MCVRTRKKKCSLLSEYQRRNAMYLTDAFLEKKEKKKVEQRSCRYELSGGPARMIYSTRKEKSEISDAATHARAESLCHSEWIRTVRGYVTLALATNRMREVKFLGREKSRLKSPRDERGVSALFPK